MGMRHASVAGLLALATGCGPTEDGPGFYGTVILAAGSSQAAEMPPAQAAPLVERAVALMLPRAARVVPSPWVPGIPVRTPRKTVIGHRPERWRQGDVIIATAVPQRANIRDLDVSVNEVLEPLGMRARLHLCNESTTCLWRAATLDGKDLDGEQTRTAARAIHQARDVRFASVNRFRWAAAVANDEYRGLQWHYDQLNLPSAWDVTTGDSSVVVAVVDTGQSGSNPDFDGRLGQGADLISDASRSNDNDARDNDATDPGDEGAGGGSFHGTHCAGTIGAATNNGKGVAGVSWAGTVQAVRVLGVGGGTEFDIVGGIRWANGEDVEGVNRNATPADVISMSLGGRGESSAEAEAIQAAVDRGALVLVAAGNENEDASAFSPANIGVAITVGAVGHTGRRASYSNYGNVVDIMAPGGEMQEDNNGDGYADGVLSTVQTSYDFMQGTSMATPHAAGVAVLMKSLNRGLTQQDAATILRDTARQDITCSECGGAPLIDAAAVVAQIGTNGGAFLSITPGSIDLGRDENTATLTVRNSGGQALDWTAVFQGSPAGFALSSMSGSLQPRSAVDVAITLTRAERTGDAVLLLSAAGLNQDRTVRLHFDDAVPRARPNVTTAFVAAFTQDENGDLQVAKLTTGDDAFVSTSRDEGFAYKLQPMAEGSYLLVGLTDDNGDGTWQDGEGIGLYPDLSDPQFVTLGKDQKLEGVSFLVRPAFLGGDAQCPPNSTLDGDTCYCNVGYEPSPDGSGCVATGGSTCPPNSTSDGMGGCSCNQGYVPNPAGDACVPEENPCPPNSHLESDGSCYCDTGYMVNETGDACVPA